VVLFPCGVVVVVTFDTGGMLDVARVVVGDDGEEEGAPMVVVNTANTGEELGVSVVNTDEMLKKTADEVEVEVGEVDVDVVDAADDVVVVEPACALVVGVAED